MPDEHTERAGITAAVASTDWTRYAGPASDVRRRGERRKQRRQATVALGTTLAVFGVVAGAYGLNKGPGAQQGATPATSTPTSAAPSVPVGSPADYPSYPAKLPTKPVLVPGPARVRTSGVMGAGSVASHQWQLSYAVTAGTSAADSQPVRFEVDAVLDGTPSTAFSWDGATPQAQGYVTLPVSDRSAPYTQSPIVLAYGTPTPGVTSVDLRWKNGKVVQVPIETVMGVRYASFAWDPANPPDVLEQVAPTGVSKITITHDGQQMWSPNPGPMGQVQLPAPIAGATPSAVTTPTGTPNLSQEPQVKAISKGILGEGTVSGHSWQFAYEIIPSGSAANSSPEVFCTETSFDATTQQGGCTSSKPFTPQLDGFYYDPHDVFPLVLDYGEVEAATTSAGFEWADGTKSVTAVTEVEGAPMVALAFDQANPPSYLLEYGSYGEYRIPLVHVLQYTWTFNWPN